MAKAAVRSKAVVLLLLTFFIVTPIVGVCNCSMFCFKLLYVHSSIAIILMGEGTGCFALFVFLVSRGG